MKKVMDVIDRLFPPIKPQNVSTTTFVPSSTQVDLAPPAIVRPEATMVDDFAEQRTARQQSARMQNEFINALMKEANVNVSNYVASFFASRIVGAPGTASTKMSSLGELYGALNSGEFEPNEALGETPISADFYRNTYIELSKKYGVGDYARRFGNRPKFKSEILNRDPK